MTTCKKCKTAWITGEKGCPFCHAKGKDNLIIEPEEAHEPSVLSYTGSLKVQATQKKKIKLTEAFGSKGRRPE